jgi:glycosyltransferase involved in cell wall biosynthesis
MTPIISIIIRTYNSGETIARTLDSVRAQSINPDQYEVLVVDDGSSDDTILIVRNQPQTVRLFENHHLGAMKALNFGLRQAIGSYYTILDSDDTLPPTALAELLAGLKANPAAVGVYGNYREVTTTGEGTLIDTSSNIFTTLAGGIIFKKESVIERGLYDDSLFFPEYDLLIRLLEKYPIVHIDKEVYGYFRRADSMTGDKEKVQAGIQQINQKYGKVFPIREY